MLLAIIQGIIVLVISVIKLLRNNSSNDYTLNLYSTYSGLDDARNTARLAWRMISDGCIMQITKSLDGVNI